MVFHPPAWVPQLPFDPPDSITIADFMQSEEYGRHPTSLSRNPFTCGVTGRTYSVKDFFARCELLSRSIARRLEWSPNDGTPWDKVIAIFSLNSIDWITLCYATHRLSGIVSPANAAYSAAELEHQLRSSGAKALVTCVPLLDTALQAAHAVGIPDDKIFIFSLPGVEDMPRFTTVDSLISEAAKLPTLEALRWTRGQGARQPAFLCYSSGTSGLPKAVMISHRNVIANAMQHAAFDKPTRDRRGVTTQNTLGPLPLSHIYGLVVVSHTGPYRGDGIIVLPSFDFEQYLGAIQRFKVNQLIVVPPIIIRLLRTQEVCQKYDLSSVRFVYSGAAPLGDETIGDLKKIYPSWTIGQAYGMTETSTVVTSTSEDDVVSRSSGSLIPGAKIKLLTPDGREITEHDRPGELYVQAPSVVLGYLNNEKATSETFVVHDDGRWIRTGDEGLVTVAPSGNEHVVIVDRIKELIKVKGHQVAPAELEAHLLTHPAVSDCAVIDTPDERAGEVPKAFVVKTPAYESKPDAEVAAAIAKHVADHKASYKWLKGGVEFLEAIPKSPSGKILRRLLRDKEKAARARQGAKL
ncbi:phenylacetyl-ligase [Microdochium bolleyi]|uniref:Phenylacetyl-ligase n=1 Tax=Microdochium bolleyi TaxID=196109 RepID=A0A136ITS5_9PEZI|nr:phenylacetyl-ligase [Microdochium bolleyi]